VKVLFDQRFGLLRAARRMVLVVGAGALGAVVCSTGVYLLAPVAGPNSTGAGRGGSSVSPSSDTERSLGASERRALALLRKAGFAESDVGYQGTKVFRSWSIWGQASTTALVRNVPGKGTTMEANSKSVTVENVLDLSDATLVLLVDNYRLEAFPGLRLLGRPVTRVDVTRPSGAAVGRFWIDDATGLTLQRDLLGSDGNLVRRTAFTKVSIAALTVAPMVGVSPSPAASTATDDCDDGLAAADVDRLRAAGWDLPAELPGSLSEVCAREVGTGAGRSVQLSYSDGLFALSLFVQRGRLGVLPAGFGRYEISSTPVYLRCGLYRELTWAGKGMVYTVVTDAPDSVVSEVVAAVPTTKRSEGVADRMSRGIRRVGSWVDPFH
jgi:sigma-E factor negative regulatory protein RseB